MPKALLGLGANVGDPVENLRFAIRELDRACGVKRVSSLYRTEPVGYDKQDWFLNAAAVVEIELTPIELLQLIGRIEAAAGRERSVPNGPRTLDIDILLCEDEELHQELEIPHPRMHLRRFVLEPAVEIAGDWVHPLQERALHAILSALPAGQAVERITLGGWPPSPRP